MTATPASIPVGRVRRPESAALRRSGLILAAALALVRPRAARADNDVSYEHEEYREMGGRVAVDTDTALINQDLGTDAHLAIGGVIDTIAGATPTGAPAPAGSDQVPLTHETGRRHAWNVDFSNQFPAIYVDAGFARSLEHDYVSNGWSLNTHADFNHKNTTLLLGAAGTDDQVQVFFKPAWLRKLSNDVTAGVTQLIDPRTSMSVNLTWTRETGYLSDPYKVIEEDIQIFPGILLPETFTENRPNQRDRGDLLASLNHAFPSVQGAVEASYRLYHDTYGITASTLEALWFQHIGRQFILRPNLRLYRQSAADFYRYSFLDVHTDPAHGPRGPYYSSDARLSAFDSLDFGAKAIWNATGRLSFDLAIDGYRQRGTDEITPQSAYYRARIVTFGGRLSW